MATSRGPLNQPRPSWAWQDDAACHGEDLILFFSPDGERQPERDRRERKAKAICAQCPVRNECLDYALSRPEKYGTGGGLNEDERASERRRRQRRTTAVRAVETQERQPETVAS
jgi:WhiB family redox-sensing transcriptional regulator